MNPAHNSYTGPKTQYTKFTFHREMGVGASGAGGAPGAGLSLKTAGAEVVRSKQVGAPACQSGPVPDPRPPPDWGSLGVRLTLIPSQRCTPKPQPSTCSHASPQLWPLWIELISS